MAVKDQVLKDDYALYNGDCVEVMQTMPDDSIDMMLFSPPFAELYCYSDNPKDIGNVRSYAEFFEHFSYLIADLKRTLKPGRLCVVHCIDIPAMKERDGYIGLKDFPGDMIRAFEAEGFIYHSRNIIWKDPLIEATRTKAHGLMHKQLTKDSAMCRAGLPDYLLAFRVPGENENPITHEDGLQYYAGNEELQATGEKRSHLIWRKYASPVWTDIRQTNVLDYKGARDAEDEKHICPLQMDVIHRAVVLWSNPGEVVATPFMGIGSEVCGAILNDRKGLGIELKDSYYKQAVRNLENAEKENKQDKLF